MGTPLVINTTHLSHIFELGHMYQFIGEIVEEEVIFDCSSIELTVKNTKNVTARIVRPINGLDTSLYEKAVEIKRKFEKNIYINK
jgi:hypothetical protein